MVLSEDGGMAKSVHSAEAHAEKMCALACCPCDLPLKKLKELVRGAQYICKSCGHVAANRKNLCQPVKIG